MFNSTDLYNVEGGKKLKMEIVGFCQMTKYIQSNMVKIEIEVEWGGMSGLMNMKHLNIESSYFKTV